MAQWLSWLERRPVTAEVVGSSPIWVVYFKNEVRIKYFYGILAQLGEHLPYKQRVIGSSPIGPIGYTLLPSRFYKAGTITTTYADVAQLAEQLTCNQQVIGSSPIVGLVIWMGSRVAKGGRL